MIASYVAGFLIDLPWSAPPGGVLVYGILAHLPSPSSPSSRAPISLVSAITSSTMTLASCHANIVFCKRMAMNTSFLSSVPRCNRVTTKIVFSLGHRLHVGWIDAAPIPTQVIYS